MITMMIPFPLFLALLGMPPPTPPYWLNPSFSEKHNASVPRTHNPPKTIVL